MCPDVILLISVIHVHTMCTPWGIHVPWRHLLTLTPSRLFLILLDPKSFQTALDSTPAYVHVTSRSRTYLLSRCRLIITTTISLLCPNPNPKVCPHPCAITLSLLQTPCHLYLLFFLCSICWATYWYWCLDGFDQKKHHRKARTEDGWGEDTTTYSWLFWRGDFRAAANKILFTLTNIDNILWKYNIVYMLVNNRLEHSMLLGLIFIHLSQLVISFKIRTFMAKCCRHNIIMLNYKISTSSIFTMEVPDISLRSNKTILLDLIDYQVQFTPESKSLWGCIRVCTKYGNLYKEHRVMDFVNDLGFSLCAAPSVCCRVVT